MIAAGMCFVSPSFFGRLVLTFLLTFLPAVGGLSIQYNPALAQENTEESAQEGEEEATAPTSPKSLPPAYENQMLRLAEILGSLHYLRELCGANEGQAWREEMQAMLAAEEPVSARRSQLIARFNRGFRGYREIYRECTLPASEAANQFLKQGIRLASEIPNRFGN